MEPKSEAERPRERFGVPRNPFTAPAVIRSQIQGNPVGKATKVVGKRIGGAQRAEQARSQKRRDTKR